jgi:hypothetical protein
MADRAHTRLRGGTLGIVALGVSGLAALPAAAETIVVADGASIQAAIGNALDGDVVLVEPGTYFETIDFSGKAITVRSSGGPEVTIIDAGAMDTAVYCWSGEGPDTVLDGFMITNGFGFGGGGMYNIGTSPTVVNCTFLNNEAMYEGGGMLNDGASPSVINCRFLGNLAYFGGGMSNIFGSPLVTNCLFSGNVVQFDGTGGGMDNFTYSDATIVNCSFSNNSAASGGAIHNGNGSNPVIASSVMWGNVASFAGNELLNSGGANPLVRYCNIAGSGGSDVWVPEFGQDGGGNVDADPLFADADGADDQPGTADDDLSPLPGSPSIDAASNLEIPADFLDLDEDGDVEEPLPVDLLRGGRFMDDPDAPDSGEGESPLADIGAYELQVEASGDSGPNLDLAPAECPNYFDPRDNGRFSAALLGEEDFDVEDVDLSSLMLMRADGAGEPVEPIIRRGRAWTRTAYRDVSAPFEGGPCECASLGPDGLIDLSLEFSNRKLASALELDGVPAGESVELVMVGAMNDGTPFSASDCITLPPSCECDLDGDGYVDVSDLRLVIMSWGQHGGEADLNGDGRVNVLDLLIVVRNWGACF